MDVKEKMELINMKKSTVLKVIHVYSAFLISAGTLICYKLIANPGLIHTLVGFAALFSLFAAVFSLFAGLKLYRNAK
ncbi:MAG: hypothetical protein HXS44_16590 [Theionarchaea archaeon]|nr:hypothetical protein [Theionarchaea archaeon]